MTNLEFIPINGEWTVTLKSLADWCDAPEQRFSKTAKKLKELLAK